jgi:hypothetical protein
MENFCEIFFDGGMTEIGISISVLTFGILWDRLCKSKSIGAAGLRPHIWGVGGGRG